VSFPSNYSRYVAPPGKSAVLAEITTCHFGSNTWERKDEEIINRVINDLHSLRVINRTDVCFVRVQRMQYAYVINDLNYEENMNTVREYAAGIGIDLVGRFAEFKYLNMDACIRRAMDYIKERFLKKEQHRKSALAFRRPEA
jgi:protoporphyrinogen oxidase